METPAQAVPVLAAYMQSTAYNWALTSEPQAGSCLGELQSNEPLEKQYFHRLTVIQGMENQRCGCPRGKGLGGSSVINYMIYNRGNRNDYDRWAAAGNTGWSWSEVLPYFLRSERSTLGDLRNSRNHNSNGWLNVEYNQFRTQLAEGFVKANNYLGINQIDYNSGNQLGVSYLQANTKRGKRHSAYKAFLEPILGRPNLHIMVSTRVTKVLIDPKTKVAYGVEMLRNRKRTQVMARKEVILSAGTFSSPQLLMLSGVGAKKDLSRIGVPLIKELPVGKLMYDHVSHLGPTFVVNTTGESLNTDRALNVNAALEYLGGRGILTVPGGVEALGFFKTKVPSNRGAEVPNLELIFVAGGFHSDQGAGISRGIGLREGLYKQIYGSLEDTRIDTFSIMPMLFHPKSVGYLELKSSNIFHWPRLYPNFLKHPDDVEVLLEGIKLSLRLAQTPPFKRLGARIHSIPLPSCAHLHFGSDNYWRCSIRTISSTLHHQVSTCKMGPQSDPTAVVSPELKVHGIHKLRVVDTSIIPEAPTAHTNAASYMIGEKASDMIKRQWRGNR